MSALAIQSTEAALIRLAFFLFVYLAPAVLALVDPHEWMALGLAVGLAPGVWRAGRRLLRQRRLSPDLLLYPILTCLMGMVVAGVSLTLGWVSIPCWCLVAFEQAGRRRRGLRFS